MRDYWLFTMEFPPWYGGGISTYCLHSIQALKEHYHLTVFVCDDSIGEPQIVSQEDGYCLVRFRIREYYPGTSLGAVNISKSFAEVAELVASGAVTTVGTAAQAGAGGSAAVASGAVAVAGAATDADTAGGVARVTDGTPQVIEFHDYMGIGFEMMHQKLKGQGGFGSTLMLVCVHAPVYLLDPVDGLKLPRWPRWVIEKLLPISLSLAYRLRGLRAFREPKLWLYSLERFCTQHADGLIFISKHIRQQVCKSFGWEDNVVDGVRGHSMAVIPNPYHLSCPANAELEPIEAAAEPLEILAALGTDGSATRALDAIPELSFFGRLHTLKGVPMLAGMLKRRFWDKGIDVRLNLYGRDIYNYVFKMDTGDYLRQTYAAEVAAGLLRLHGEVSPEYLEQASAKSVAVVMPSLIENFPYAVCEQMAFGKICLVSHSGGHAEIVEDGVSGFVYRDEDEFEAKLNRILSLSAEEQSRMSQAAQSRIQTLCDYDSFYKRKEQFLCHCGLDPQSE